PNLGPPADPGLRYFAQTSDGFIHSATATSEFVGAANGVNVYVVVIGPLQFAPLITFHEVLTTVNFSYANNAAGTIFFTGADILGTFGFIGTFNFNTVNDT